MIYWTHGTRGTQVDLTKAIWKIALLLNITIVLAAWFLMELIER